MVSFDDTLLLIEPEAAKQYAIEQKKLIVVERSQETGRQRGSDIDCLRRHDGHGDLEKKPDGVGPAPAREGEVVPRQRRGQRHAGQVATHHHRGRGDRSCSASDPNATVRITLEIDAEFPNGASDTIKRGVSENATSLGVQDEGLGVITKRSLTRRVTATRSEETASFLPCLPPLVCRHNGWLAVMGQRKWDVSRGLPSLCHRGISLLEAAVSSIERPPL